MPSESERVGLCASCRHARRVPTPRTTFWLCRLAAVEPRFDKYPRLPVLECEGYVPRVPGDTEITPTD